MMTRAYFDSRPRVFDPVGNGDFLYHWDITEEEVQVMPEGIADSMSGRTLFSCLEAVIHGKPEYDKCVEAVIRHSYTLEAELAMVNKFNSYQTGVISDESILSEYENYLRFVAAAKEMVRKDLEHGETDGHQRNHL